MNNTDTELPKEVDTAGVEKKMSLNGIVIATVMGALLGGGASWFATKHQITELQNRLSQTPPIVVVDFGKIALTYPSGASPEQMDKLMVKTNNAVAKLKDAGYLILDSSSVLAAPNDVYLPTEVISGE